MFAALLAGVIYWPGLSGSLYLDSAKLYQIEQIYREQGPRPELADLGFASKYGRIIPQLSFYLNIVISDGVDPYTVKMTNVVIHVVNSVLVFLFAVTLLARTRYREQAPLLAAAVALVWLISAVNVSGVLYAVQRMNQLATLFSLAALISYVRFRGAQAGRAMSVVRWLALAASVGTFSMLAYASKETALLIPVFILLIELFIFPELPQWLKTKAGIATTVMALLVSVALLIGFVPGRGLMDYSQLSFTLEERALTQVRILWMYIGQLIVPTTTAIGLYQDGLPVSTGLFSPPSTAVGLAGLAGLVIFAIRYRGHKSIGIVAFGLAFFLGGHMLESSIFPLELYYEHRNYLPSVGLYLAFVVSVHRVLRSIPKPYAIGIALAYFVAVAFVAHSKAVTWSDEQRAYELALARDYVSPRAAGEMAQLYLEHGQIAPAVALLDRVIAESPHQAFRARLQKLYVQCATGATLDQRLYDRLAEVSGRELAIEASQAISNVVNVYTTTGCDAISVDRLIPALESVSATLRADGRSSWHVDYYVGELYATFDKQRAALWLERRFMDGEESAGWALIPLLEEDEDIRVAPDTVEALDVLRAGEP